RGTSHGVRSAYGELGGQQGGTKIPSKCVKFLVLDRNPQAHALPGRSERCESVEEGRSTPRRSGTQHRLVCLSRRTACKRVRSQRRTQAGPARLDRGVALPG